MYMHVYIHMYIYIHIYIHIRKRAVINKKHINEKFNSSLHAYV